MINKSALVAGFAGLAAAQQVYTGPGGNATVQSGLPQATYTAVLPATNFNNNTGSVITGSISGKTSSNGTGVVFTVNFQGLPSVSQYGPFIYHIHEAPVTNGNCTTALAHLDPTQRGEVPACMSDYPASCQAGDLSGKHGNITGTSLQTTYTDLYLSTDPSSPYFFGNKSIVIHSSNKTRLTCANFAMGSDNSSSSSGSNGTTTGSPKPSSSGSSGSSGSSSSGAGAAFNVGGGIMVGVLSVAMFALL